MQTIAEVFVLGYGAVSICAAAAGIYWNITDGRKEK